MALTKVTGPLVSGSTNNLGDYTVNNITGVAATFSGNLSVGGTITYQDVTSIDSVGIITAQAGIHLGIGATTGKIDVATGISTFTKVGIGSDNPDALLSLSGTDSRIRLTKSNAAANLKHWDLAAQGQILRLQAKNDAGSGGGNIFDFYKSTNQINEFRGLNAGNTWFVINNDSKKVGIGTTNPNVSLEVLNDSPGLRLSDNNSSAGANSYTQLTNINGNTYVYARANSNNGSYLIGGQGGGTFDEYVRITNTGKVGIGTGNPSEKLSIENGNIFIRDISDNESYIYFTHSSIANRRSYIGAVEGTGNSNSLVFATNADGADAVEKLRITSDGKVGIGTTNPTALLHLQGTGGDTSGLYFKNGPHDAVRQYFSDANDDSDFVITYEGTGAAELTLHSTGVLGLNEANGDDVLIGAGSVIGDARLTIGKSAAGFTTAIALHNTGGEGSKIISSRSLVLGADYDNDTGTDGSIIAFEPNGTEKVRIDSSGYVGINTNTNLKAPLHVAHDDGGFDTTPYNKAAIFGSQGWVTDSRYHYTDATIFISGRNNAGIDTGAGIEFTTRTVADNNWRHGAITFGQDGNFRVLNGGAGTSEGTEKVCIDTTGKVGIGSTVPTLGLDINKGANSGVFLGNPIHGYQVRANVTSSNDYGLMIEDEDGNDLYRAVASTGTSNANTHTFFTAGSERFRILANADITFTGVDTSFATIMYASNFTKLDLRGTNIANSYHYILSYGEGHAEADHFHMVNKTTNGSLVFRTGSSTDTRLTIKSDGETNIGTGVVNIAKFCQSGNHHQIVGQAADDVAALDVYSQHGNDGNRISFAVSDNRTGSKSNSFVVRGNGQVGIGTEEFYDSSTKLEVKGRINTVGSASTGSINPGNGTVVNVGSLTNHNLQLITGNSTRVTIVQGGTSGEAMRISGVGVTVQSSLTPNFEVQTTAASGQDCKITLKGARTSSSTSSIAMIRFVNDTSSSYTMGEIVGMDPAGSHTSQIGDLVFRTTHNDTTTEVARFTGGATAAGRNLKFANGSGIDFSATANSPGANSDTSNEVLDDYERGTFDFKLEDANSGSDTLKMHYVKVGSVVHCYGPFRGSSGDTASVFWQLSGTTDSNITTTCELPFIPVDSGACESPIYRNIETRESTPNNPADGDTMPVLGWAAGDSTCRLTDTRTEKSYNAYTGGDTMRKADTRTNVVLHFNFCYVTNS